MNHIKTWSNKVKNMEASRIEVLGRIRIEFLGTSQKYIDVWTEVYE